MTPNEFEMTLSDAEVQLTLIKHLYEQRFQGQERMEPQIARKQFDRLMHELRKSPPRNTALRFRFQTLIQRYTTLQSYWQRVGRQIEEGTYRRDLLKARRRRENSRAERAAERKVRRSSANELDPEADLNVNAVMAEAEAHVEALTREAKPSSARIPTTSQRPQGTVARFGKPQSSLPPKDQRPPVAATPTTERRGPVPAPPRPKPASKAPPSLPNRAKGPGEARLRQIYDAYLSAKKGNNERVDKVDYETVAKSIKKMVPKLDRKHKGKQIDFEVVVKNGRVGLKPVVKK